MNTILTISFYFHGLLVFPQILVRIIMTDTLLFRCLRFSCYMIIPKNHDLPGRSNCCILILTSCFNIDPLKTIEF